MAMSATDWVSMELAGIRGCSGHNHPVLLLREARGGRQALVRLDDGEARHLAEVFSGSRPRRRPYETLARTIAGLGAAVTALRLAGDRRCGLYGEIELIVDRHRTLVRAHPADVAALAWQLGAEVQLPSAVTSSESGSCQEWWPAQAREITPTAAAGLGAVLHEAEPEDYDW